MLGCQWIVGFHMLLLKKIVCPFNLQRWAMMFGCIMGLVPMIIARMRSWWSTSQSFGTFHHSHGQRTSLQAWCTSKRLFRTSSSFWSWLLVPQSLKWSLSIMRTHPFWHNWALMLFSLFLVPTWILNIRLTLMISFGIQSDNWAYHTFKETTG